MASTYLTRSVSSTGNRRKWTWSGWLKRGNLGTSYIMSSNNGSNQYSMLQFDSTNVLRYYDYTSTFQTHLKTNRVFRDLNAWYHIVVAYDSAQSTAADRMKIYVNGTQETSFGTSSYPSQNYDSYMNYSGVPHYLGRETGTGSLYDGVMSHVHFTDGYAYAASDFGLTDATTGEWKIKTVPSVSYGTNGYFMFKDDNSVNDDSGNGNNFTLTAGTLTKTEDCPSNVFATLNPLVRVAGNITYSSGNTKIARAGSAQWRTCYSTLAMTTGKYYFEALSNAGSNNVIGIRELQNADGSTAGSGNDYPGYTSQGWSLYNQNGTVYNNNVTSGSAIGTFTDGDYIGVFLDCDNQKLYFSKNGTMLNTTGYSISAVPYVFGVALYDDGGAFSCNFGNGAFGSTQLTGTTYNGSDGNGIFKYNPNSITLDGSSKSFKSLSTKGLNA